MMKQTMTKKASPMKMGTLKLGSHKTKKTYTKMAKKMKKGM